MSILRYLYIGAVWVGLMMAAAARADEIPDPRMISVRAVNATGTGCQSGQVSSVVAPDGSAFSVMFDHYESIAGGGGVRVDKKACEIDVEMAVPSGWSFTLFTADYRGFANVDAGATGFHEVVYTFDRPGSSPQGPPVNPHNGSPVQRTGNFSFSTKEFRGPFTGDYSIHNELSVQNLAWSPCDTTTTKTLHMSTSLLTRVLGADNRPHVQMSLDSVDGALAQQFGIKWRRCEIGRAHV